MTQIGEVLAIVVGGSMLTLVILGAIAILYTAVDENRPIDGKRKMILEKVFNATLLVFFLSAIGLFATVSVFAAGFMTGALLIYFVAQVLRNKLNKLIYRGILVLSLVLALATFVAVLLASFQNL